MSPVGTRGLTWALGGGICRSETRMESGTNHSLVGTYGSRMLGDFGSYVGSNPTRGICTSVIGPANDVVQSSDRATCGNKLIDDSNGS